VNSLYFIKFCYLKSNCRENGIYIFRFLIRNDIRSGYSCEKCSLFSLHISPRDFSERIETGVCKRSEHLGFQESYSTPKTPQTYPYSINYSCPIFSPIFSTSDICKKIKVLKPIFSPGPDGIPSLDLMAFLSTVLTLFAFH